MAQLNIIQNAWKKERENTAKFQERERRSIRTQGYCGPVSKLKSWINIIDFHARLPSASDLLHHYTRRRCILTEWMDVIATVYHYFWDFNAISFRLIISSTKLECTVADFRKG